MTVAVVGLALVFTFALWRIKLTELALIAMPFMFYVPAGLMLNMSLADLLVPLLVLRVLMVVAGDRTTFDTRIGRYVFSTAVFLSFSVFVSVVASARTDGLLAAISAGKLFIGVVFFACLAVLLIRDVQADNLRFLNAWSLVAVVISVVTLSDLVLGTAFLRTYGDVRASGTFEDPNLFAVYLVLSLVIHVLVLDRRFSAIAIVGVILTLPAMLATGSRAGVAALAVTAVLLLLVTRRRPRRLVIIVIAAAAAASRFFVPEALMPGLDRLSDSSADLGSDSRYDLWAEAWSTFLEHPILGNGAGEFLESTGHVVHNTYISLLTSFGIIGVLVIGRVPVAMFIRSMLRMRIRTPGLVWVGFVGLAIEMATLDLENVRFVWAYFAVGAALLYADRRDSPADAEAVKQRPEAGNPAIPVALGARSRGSAS